MSLTAASTTLDPPSLNISIDPTNTDPTTATAIDSTTTITTAPLPSNPPDEVATPPPPVVMADDADDADMAMSVVMTTPAQNQDRIDTSMQGTDPGSEPTATQTPAIPQLSPTITSSDDEWVDEDAMDLSPDATNTAPPPPPPVLNTNSAPNSPPPNPPQLQQPAETQEPVVEAAIPPQGGSTNTTQSTNDDDGSEETSSEEDYDEDYDEEWHSITEDRSEPSEDELKAINKHEQYATDHSHFEGLLRKDLEHPEYGVAGTGRIEWAIDHYNGTRENPNRELLMKSQIVNVGGYDWQIKFYPRGNESDYLSLYVDCVSIPHENYKEQLRDKQLRSKSGRRSSQKDSTTSIPAPAAARNVQPQDTPFPMLNDKKYPKREGVAAQVIVVLYNPTEPRTFFHRVGLHRFCPMSPDWGWTRFHGPFFEIGMRQPGQRQALLRDDKLAITAYIQTIDDDTGCLWEHNTRDNPWDCFAMTGLQGLTGSSQGSRAYVPAVASWLLLKPFRELLYEIPTRDEQFEHLTEPRPIISALQKLLYEFRALPKPDTSDKWRKPVSLAALTRGLSEAGINSISHKCDVIEAWEVIRYQIEQELKSTEWSTRMQEIFGPERVRSTSLQNQSHSGTYKIGVHGANSVQEALNNSFTELGDFLHPSDLPPFLHIELGRQYYDAKSRSWKKAVNKFKINQHIDCAGSEYTLYGLITHQDDFQSGNYSAMVRPNGPGTSWFQFTDKKAHLDGKEEKVLTRIPSKMAVEQHEGVSGRKDDNASVAYVLMYIRDSEAQEQFDPLTEPEWTPPAWIVRPPRFGAVRELALGIGEEETTPTKDIKKKSKKPSKRSINSTTVDVIAIKSTAFSESSSTKTGIVRTWPTAPLDNWSIRLSMPYGITGTEISKKLAPMLGVADHRQIKVFEMLSNSKEGWPNFELHADTSPFGSFADHDGETQMPRKIERWLWFHVLSEDELKAQIKAAEALIKKEKVPPTSHTADTTGGASSSTPRPQQSSTSQPNTSNANADAAVDNGQDTVMSESEEDRINTAMRAAGQAIFGTPPGAVDTGFGIPHFVPPTNETSASGSGSRSGLQIPPPPPPTLSNLIPPPPIFTMPSTLDGLATPPVVAAVRRAGGIHSSSRMPSRDRDIYFFLKTWDPETQTLKHLGMFYTPSSIRVDQVVQKILRVSKEPHLPLFQQLTPTIVETIKRRKSFDDLRLSTGDVIIVQTTLIDHDAPGAEEKLASLLETGGFAFLKDYLLSFSKDLSTPWTRSTTDARLDYFGQESYTGSLLNHLPHGEGEKIYYNGDVYAGTFALGLRHGKGRMTYANGDIYTGEWARNVHEGLGKYIDYSTLNTYEGGWRDNRRYGEGVTHWKRAEEGEKVCRVCWEEPAEAAFFDCGHVVACIGCARRVDLCPVCRRKVLSALKLFYVA